MDRRIEKTRKAIFEAFIRLLKKKDFESITVSEIADVADINRVTVYKHFSDKYDLLEQCIDHILSQFLADCGSDEMEKLTLNAFDYLYNNRSTLRLLLNSTGSSALKNKIASSFINLDNFHIITKGNTPLYAEMKTQYLISALSGVFEWWLTAPDHYSTNDACATFLTILSEFFPEYNASYTNKQ